MWGWKTILAALFWALANALKDGPEPWGMIGRVLEIIYPLLFGIGVAHKFIKLNRS
jgi:hypothetical protein